MTYHKISAHADEFARELECVSDKLNLTFSEVQIKQLLGYLDNLLLWTKAYNLTALPPQKRRLLSIFWTVWQSWRICRLLINQA